MRVAGARRLCAACPERALLLSTYRKFSRCAVFWNARRRKSHQKRAGGVRMADGVMFPS
jgi:hypothetical protein